MTNILIFNVTLLAACGFALFRGAAPERLAALLMILAAVASFVAGSSFRFTRVESSVFLIDTILMVGLVAVALRANRFWPIWLASLQIVAFAFHGVRAYVHDLPGWSYQRAVSLIAYPMLLILLVGAQRHHARSKCGAPEPSWTPLS